MSWNIASTGKGSNLSYSQAGTPSLDLRFAETKALTDYTTGQNLVTFSRASGGTYVDSQGVIRNAVTNLLVRSEEFTTTWTKDAGVTITTDPSQGQPFSGAQVYRVDYTGANQVGPEQALTFVTTAYTGSFWIKGTAGESIRFTGQTGGVSAANYTLDGSWQRITQSWTGVPGSSAFNLNTFGGATARTIYITAAQLEQSSTVGEYIPTGATINSAPRFDHNPTTGESLGLLVEESRTNLLLRSEEFDNAAWFSGAGAGLLAFGSGSTVNATLAPNGTTTADLIVEDTANSQHSVNQAAITSSGATVTFSCYIKAADRSFARLIVYDAANTSNNLFCFFDLGTGVAGTPAINGTGTQSGSTIQNVGNGWYRCSVTGAVPGATTYQARINIAPSISTVTYTGDGTSGIYIWGAQLEAGAFPTSYIPTTTSAVTRAADVCSISGSNFSSWYRQDEGTLYFNGSIFGIPSSGTDYRRITSLCGADVNTDEISIYRRSSDGLIGGVITESAVVTFDDGILSVATNTAFKSAIGYKTNDTSVAFNGTGKPTDTSVVLPVVTSLQIGQAVRYQPMPNSHIRRLTYWPQRLSNSTLQSITA